MRAFLIHRDRFPAWLASMALAGMLTACGGGERPPAEDATSGAAPGAAPATPPPAAETPPAGDTQTAADTQPAPAGGAQPGTADQGLIALGDSIFHGQAGGGTCYACHGQDGTGSAVGPNLTDGEWLNTDGTLEGITKTVQTGVPTPKKAPAPMPPMGGATLSPEQLRAVAAYVHSLSKKG